MKKFYLVIIILLLPLLTIAGIIKGKITDASGEALPYATVFVAGTTIGVNANGNGMFELNIPPGAYKVACQYIGYKQSAFEVTISGDEVIQHNFKLQAQGLEMKEVVIHASKEDPAYPIIRKAIKQRAYHLNQIKTFETGIYLKLVIRNRKAPEKVMGEKIKAADLAEAGIDSVGKGIFYLAEEEADYYKDDKKQRTVIHSVKESGKPGGVGVPQFPSVISFYQNDIPITGKRAFISPINSNALNYYKYKLLGEFKEGDKTIYKIKVIQKRPYEPCFNGDIYITDGDWAIHSLNMQLTKTSGLDLIDTINIDQLYLPVKKDEWVIKSQLINFSINIFGFDLLGDAVTVYNNQKTNEPIPDTIFNGGIISSYDAGANKKDSGYFDAARPIPLERDEKHDYVIKDSISQKQNSPAHLDSVRRKGNKPGLIALTFTGYTYNTKNYKNSFDLNPIIVGIGVDNIINYNIVEGLNIAPKIGWVHRIDSNKALHAALAVRYGFANTHFNSIARLYYTTQDKHWHGRQWLFGVEGGKYVFQYNPDNPVLPIFNTATALFNYGNDLKLYERWDGGVYAGRQYGNGFSWFVKLQYQQRLPLDTTTNFTIAKWSTTGFNSNLPDHLAKVTVWEKNDAALAHASVSYQPGFKYIQYPDYKVGGSHYPIFTATYDKGIPDLFNSKVNYDKWRFDVRHTFGTGLLGSISYNAAVGGFINSNYVSVPDLMHLYGNRGIGYAAPYLQSFQFAQYYDFSNKEPFYGELHLEYNLNGFLSNKIPLLRQARWNLLFGTNSWYASRNDYYTEAFVGIDNIGWKIFRVLRIDFVQSWSNYTGINSGIRFGFNTGKFSGIKVNETSSEW